MKEVKKEGNILFLSQNRPKTPALSSYEVDRKIEKIMLLRLLAASGEDSSCAASHRDMTTRKSRVEYLFKSLKIIVCILFLLSLVLSSAILPLLALIPQVSPETLGVFGFLVIVIASLLVFSIRYDYKNHSSRELTPYSS